MAEGNRQASVRLDPPVMRKVDRYAKREKLTRSRAIEHIVRIGLDQIFPPSRDWIDDLSNPLLADRIKRLSDLHPLVAEEVARIEVEMLSQLIGGEIASWGRTFQRRVESHENRTMDDFDDVAEARYFLSVYDELTKEALAQEKQVLQEEKFRDFEDGLTLMPRVEQLQKDREKLNPRTKIHRKSKTV